MGDLLKRAKALTKSLSSDIKGLLDDAVKTRDPSLLDRTNVLMQDLRRELQGGDSEHYTLKEAGRWSKAQLKRVLKDEMFRPDRHERGLVSRYASLGPGMSVVEYRVPKMVRNRLVAGPESTATYKVTAYRGEDAPRGRWFNSGRLDLAGALAFINEHFDEADDLARAELARGPR